MRAEKAAVVLGKAQKVAMAATPAIITTCITGITAHTVTAASIWRSMSGGLHAHHGRGHTRHTHHHD